MADKFIAALEDLKDALTNGDALDAALEEVAADHGVKTEALRNRATTAWGDLTDFGARSKEYQDLATRQKIEADEIFEFRQILDRFGKGQTELNEREKMLAQKYNFRHPKFLG